VQRRNHPHVRLAAVTAGVALALAACGDDGTEPAAQPDDSIPTTDTTTPPTGTDAPATDGVEHPTGSDEVVIEIAYEGGFLPIEAVFTQLPSLLVTGNGSHFKLGPVAAIYPGPLLPNVQVSDIGEADVQRLLELAAEHGLFTEREYESPDNIADAPDTVVTIHANGETYVHRAYALGIGSGLDGAGEEGDRAELQAFVEAARFELDQGSETVAFEPETYLLRATPVTDLTGFELPPTVVDWPAVGISLADASDCLAVPADTVGDLFADANQLTFFVEDDVTYHVAAKPQLAGDAC
jgi:hypothetical protein